MKNCKLVIVMLLMVVFSSTKAFCQKDTAFVDAWGNGIDKELSTDHYFKTVMPDSTVAGGRIDHIHYRSGKLFCAITKREVTDKKNGKKKWINDGNYRSWYESGALKCKYNLHHDSIIGELVSYWENNTVKRRENYVAGKSVGGVCFDSIGEKVAFYPYHIKAKFKSGDVALINFISQNLRYPVVDQENGVHGRVVVRFIVEKDGRIRRIKVKRSLSPTCDVEACRVISHTSLWTPSVLDGEPIDTWYDMPIDFKIE